MAPMIIGPDIEDRLDWLALTDALESGHLLPRAAIDDTFLYRGDDTLLSRAAWIDGMGAAVKTAMVFPGNPDRGLAGINGGVSVFSDVDGQLEALIDFHLVTKWKTAGDSLLCARKLARPDSRKILIVGAGTVARSMISAYRAGFPEADISIWARRPEAVDALVDEGIAVARDLPTTVGQADIVCTATMSSEPVVRGDWLAPGTHVDLIGAYRPDMRETDDAALKRARIFVDSRATTLEHIGELKIPLAEGVISRDDVVADFYDLSTGAFARRNDDEITIAKNGGGAHLDLMTCRYILSAGTG